MTETDSGTVRPEHLESFDSGIIMIGADGRVKAEFKHIPRMTNNDRKTTTNSESDEGHSSNCDQMSTTSQRDNDSIIVDSDDSDMETTTVGRPAAADWSRKPHDTTVARCLADRVSLHDDSSVVDSDEDEIVEQPPPLSAFVSEKIIGLNDNQTHDAVVMVSQPGTVAEPKTNIGSIAVKDSSDITFGNKTFYQGPVTIKQFMLTNNTWKPSNGAHDNPAFRGDGERGGNQLESDGKADVNTRRETHIDKILKRPFLLAGCVMAVVLLIIGLTVALVTLLDNDTQPVITGRNVLRLVSRGEWVAQPANGELANLDLPADKVIIAHTATDNCTNQSTCVYRVRYIQNFHIESQGWDDIGYNFLVGGDGAAYIGRGWDKQGAHTKGFNTKSIGIAFIGTFTKREPPPQQLKAARQLIEEGLRLKKLAPDYKLFAHRQLIASESPGEPLFKIIKKWPHWSDKI